LMLFVFGREWCATVEKYSNKKRQKKVMPQLR
jgi:hypothetical protein